MAIDAGIYDNALIKGPAPEDPTDQAVKLADIAAQISQRNASAESARTIAQQRIDAAKDQAAANAALQSTQGDYRAAADLLSKGGNPRASKMLSDAADARDKNAADMLGKNLSNQKDRMTLATQAIQLATPDNWQAVTVPALNAYLPDELKKGIPQQYDQSYVDNLTGTTDEGQKHIDQLQKTLSLWTDGAHLAAIGNAMISAGDDPQQRQAQAQYFKALGAPDALIQEFQNTPAAKIPDLLTTPKEKADIAETASRDAATQAYQQSELGIRRGELGVSQARLKLDQAANVPIPTGAAANVTLAPGQKNEAYLGQLDPKISTVVKAVDDGRLQLPAFALRTPYWQGIIQAVGQYDPEFDTVNFNARSKTRADFTSGKSAQQVNALNTVVGHLQTLVDAGAALDNTSLPLVNAVKNWVSTAGGSSKVTNFDTAKQAVADELTRVWRQAGGSEADIKGWQNSINASESNSQLKGAIGTIGGLIESKLSALDNQYHQGMGTAAVSIVTPEARATLDKLQGRSSAPVRMSLNGQTYDVPASGVAEAKKRGATVVP